MSWRKPDGRAAFRFPSKVSYRCVRGSTVLRTLESYDQALDTRGGSRTRRVQDHIAAAVMRLCLSRVGQIRSTGFFSRVTKKGDIRGFAKSLKLGSRCCPAGLAPCTSYRHCFHDVGTRR